MSGTHDWEMVARAREGDMAAFAELVRRYQTPVINFCRRMAGSQLDAEELAQDSFVRVFRHLDRLEPQAKFSTLLFGIARNLTLNFLRDAKRHGGGVTLSLDFAPQHPDNTRRPDRAVRLREIESTLERGIEQLSPEHREVLLLREFQGMDYETMAQICRCNKGTVKSRLARAREQLRLQLVELGGKEL
ncbi:MAG: hypothetical protein QG656_32 [Candidatus Hydrogenedentes bacterium]|nr:hypothetical protein [Candidatus Hydrogenedentota bacterium]